jgi:hypothetical protein
MKALKFAKAGNPSLTPNCLPLPRRLWLAFRMQTLVTLAHWPTGLTLRKNVLHLGLAAGQIAIGWFPCLSVGWLGCAMNFLVFFIVRHDGCTLSW